MHKLVAAVAVAAVVAACGGGGHGGATPDAGVDSTTGALTCPPPDDGPLGIAARAAEGAMHTGAICDHVCYGTSPPSSGTHYPEWAAYKTYDAPVPWGFLVHDLEHGAVVVVYNCPDGCADEVAAAKAWIAALPADPVCGTNRVILAPDPTSDVRWAAAAWHWTWRATAFDAGALALFFDAHYDAGAEEICNDGVDLSASGWCG